MSKTLIVTASSKSKTEDTEKNYHPTSKKFADLLSDENRQQFYQARSKLINEAGLEDGPDLQDKKITEDPDYIPAYLRYTGRTYSKISDKAWQNLLDNQDEFDCVILSALYGLIRFDEPIRNYDIEQATKVEDLVEGRGSTIKTFWKNQGASDWLFDYVKNNDFDKVIFVLSKSYSKIVQKDDLMTKLENELGIETEDRQFSQFGRGSMLKRGEFINELLVEQ